VFDFLSDSRLACLEKPEGGTRKLISQEGLIASRGYTVAVGRLGPFSK